jgi:hypothetical protein
MREKSFAVKAYNASGLLSSMLKRVQAKGGINAGFICAENAENRTFFLQMIIVKRVGRYQTHYPYPKITTAKVVFKRRPCAGLSTKTLVRVKVRQIFNDATCLQSCVMSAMVRNACLANWPFRH